MSRPGRIVPGMSSPEPEYAVALSFAGEQRQYVEAVHSELTKNGVRAFYDVADEVNLWGKNLAEELQRVYMSASNLVVMFISKDYATKTWPIHERRSAIAKALEVRGEYILPVRFDDADLPGLDPNVVYLPVKDRPPAKLAANIMAKLVSLGGRVEPAKPVFRVSDASADRKVCRVTVRDENGEPVNAATVVLIASNGTTSKGTTGPDGVTEIRAAVRRAVSVFVAHPDYRAGFYSKHDNGAELDVILPASPGVHSIAFAGDTGYIPGLAPRLNPIGNGQDEQGIPTGLLYMYVENGSVNGRAEQPFIFKIGHPMMLEDSEGTQARVTCVGFVGRSTLWEYEYPK